MSDIKACNPADQERRRSWRDTIQVHPAADLFPLMNTDELRELGADIRKHGGLLSPIALWRPNFDEPEVVVDGRNRLDALELELGRPVRVVGRGRRQRGTAGKVRYKNWTLECDDNDGNPVLVGDLFEEWGFWSFEDQVVVLAVGTDPWAYAASANAHRRHLTNEGKRDLIAKLLVAGPEKSDRQLADLAKVDHKTVATIRRDQEGRGEIPHVEKREDTKGRQQPTKRKPKVAEPDEPSPEVLAQRAALGVVKAAAEIIEANFDAFLKAMSPTLRRRLEARVRAEKNGDGDVDPNRTITRMVQDAIERAVAAENPNTGKVAADSLRMESLKFLRDADRKLKAMRFTYHDLVAGISADAKPKNRDATAVANAAVPPPDDGIPDRLRRAPAITTH
jgi:hypothetical protein